MALRPKLYHITYWSSSPVFQLIKHLNLEKDIDVVHFKKPEERQTEEYRKINPREKIPAFVDENGKVTLESVATAIKLVDRYDAKNELLGPLGSDKRYEALDVILFCVTGLYHILDTCFSEKSSDDMKERAREEANTKVLNFTVHLLRDGRQWALGDEVSLADFFLGYNLYGMKILGLMDHPVINEYCARYSALESSKAIYPAGEE